MNQLTMYLSINPVNIIAIERLFTSQNAIYWDWVWEIDNKNTTDNNNNKHGTVKPSDNDRHRII